METAKEEPIHPVYLPFTAAQLRGHFTSASEADKHVSKFLISANRYRNFCGRFPDRTGASIDFSARDCQIEKDEQFWTAACWLQLFYCNTRQPIIQLLQKCFGEAPPLDDLHGWQECLDGQLELLLEACLPSPIEYTRWLAENIRTRHFISYVLNAARRESDRNFEGPTHVDAILLNRDNGFGLMIEAKVLSDISCHVSFDCMRNQIARNLDVMLDSHPSTVEPLCLRRPERTLFVLQTPRVFRHNPHTRLYGWLLNAYRNDERALPRDLGHRANVNFAALRKRIGWITWEDCNRLLPDCCPWLTSALNSASNG
jgi:hypothetical protein